MSTRGALHLAESAIWIAALPSRDPRPPAFSALVDTALLHWSEAKCAEFWHWYCELPKSMGGTE